MNNTRDSEDPRFIRDLYQAVIENTSSGIYIFQDGRFVFVNKTMENLTGYSKEELLSINYLELVRPDYREILERMTNQALTGNLQNLPLRYQIPGIRKNGEEIWTEMMPTLIEYQGKVAILGNLIDITERKSIQKRIQNLSILYRDLGKAVNLSVNLSELGRNILTALKNVIDHQMSSILTCNPDENTLVLSAQIGFPDHLATMEKQRIEGKRWEVASFCARSRETVYIENIQKHKLTEHVLFLCEEYGISQIYAVPLISGDELQGVLEVLASSEKPLSENDRHLLDSISEEMAAGIAKIKAEEGLLELSQKDHLTGLYNHQYLWEKIEEQQHRDRRYGEIYSVIYLDIDNFKAYNDTYGHLEGDKVLKNMGEILREALRNPDSAYRYGGEEFVVLLPHTTKEQALKVAGRIRDEVHHRLCHSYEITVSIGITDSRVNKNVVRAADRAMYQAKREGKNRIKVL